MLHRNSSTEDAASIAISGGSSQQLRVAAAAAEEAATVVQARWRGTVDNKSLRDQLVSWLPRKRSLSFVLEKDNGEDKMQMQHQHEQMKQTLCGRSSEANFHRLHNPGTEEDLAEQRTITRTTRLDLQKVPRSCPSSAVCLYYPHYTTLITLLKNISNLEN